MKKVLLTLALIPALMACAGNIGDASNDIADSKPITADLTANETLYVYSGEFSDKYTLTGYSSVHVFGNTLELTKITYTYWEYKNTLDVETNLGLIKYRGFTTNFNIVVKYANQAQ